MMSTEARRLPATYAAIVFKGTDLDPELVSTIIGKQATLSFRRGDAYQVNRKSQKRRFGMWVYSTRNIIISDSLKIHLDTIEEMLIGAKSAWSDSRIRKIQDLVQKQKAQLRIDIFWFGIENAPFPKISRSFEQIVTMAGGSVAIDFHRNDEAIEAA